MPSCDGSNCGACSACECRVKEVRNTSEEERLKGVIKKLEQELAAKNSTERLLRRILKDNGIQL